MASDQIEHFSHVHPLVLRSSDHDSTPICQICRQNCTDLFYACDQGCDCFNIHRLCADELLPEIDHPFHPQHPLTLDLKEFNYYSKICHACGYEGNTYYACSQCQFQIDYECATLMPNKTIESNNESHPHTLFICNHTNKITLDYDCPGCDLPIEKDSIYVCLEFHSFLCQSCAELPRELKHHPFHPDHTLVLVVLASDEAEEACCSACGEESLKLVFQCSECKFNLDIHCAFLMPINSTTVNDVRHPHPLFLCENTKKFDFLCGCGKPFEDDSLSILCCLTCNKLLHKSCAELPLKIKSIFHPDHPLSLRLDYNFVNCQACLQHEEGSAYWCSSLCYVNFCIRCTLSMQHTINSELHEHPLVFITELHLATSYSRKKRCTICKFYVRSNTFRCVPCDQNFHLHCIPNLPLEASDGIHRHALKLTKSPIKDYEDEDEDSEFLCDHCEKERRLCDPTYFCAECHYVAHIHCLVSEIVRLMEEEWSLTHKIGDTNEVFELNESDNLSEETSHEDELDEYEDELEYNLSVETGHEDELDEYEDELEYSLSVETTQTSHEDVLDESDNLSVQTARTKVKVLEPEDRRKLVATVSMQEAKTSAQEAKLRGQRERLEAFEKRRAQLVD